MSGERGTAEPAVLKAIAREKYEAMRTRALETFGPWCRFCGETDPVVLTFDHIIPIRRPGAGRSVGIRTFWYGMKAGKESPFNIQILCANCHARKTRMERSQCQ